MKRLLIVAVVFALAAPAALAVPPDGKKGGQDADAQAVQSTTPTASELCKQQRRTIGMSAFRALYAPADGPKAAMTACLAKQVQTTSAAAKNAAMECKAEQADANFAGAHGGETFAEFYGTNPNGKNAFGKCVSSKATESVEDAQQATLNAAKKCKAERALGAQAFADNYGTNKNKRNAFGKCVSKYAKAQGD
jgi:hypothetical protein